MLNFYYVHSRIPFSKHQFFFFRCLRHLLSRILRSSCHLASSRVDHSENSGGGSPPLHPSWGSNEWERRDKALFLSRQNAIRQWR